MSGRRRLLVLALVVGIATAGALVQPQDPHAVDLDRVLAAPSPAHWLGTDHLGRDVASRLLAGAAPALVAIAVALAATLGLGTLAGALVALGPPALASATRRLAEIALALPVLVVALVVAAAMGAGPATAGLALAASAWAPYAITIAGLLERLSAEPYWRAAEALGLPRARAVARHLLPALAPPLGALAGADAGRAVILVASLGFLGLTGDTGRPDWGTMIHEYRMFLFDAPRLMIAPSAAIAALALALNRALDPGACSRGH